ncbi:MAG: oxidoreductase [Bryobacteraceae bacterium]
MKPKVAFYWCAACGGCEEAVVDLAENILDVVAKVDIVFWPVALDFKEKDVAAMPDGSIAVAFLNGAVRNSEQKHMAELLRRKAQTVIAFGSCAQSGGIPGLANLAGRDSILRTVYGDAQPATAHRLNGHELRLPVFHDHVDALDRVIPVDYYVPGCPPTPKMLGEALGILLGGDLPAKGAVLATDKAMCEVCTRRDTRPEKLMLSEFKRPHEMAADPEKCLLSQGLLCLGSVTRAGCEAACIKGNMPCTGCNGPTSRVRDFGGKAAAAIASLADSNDEQEIERILAGIPDPLGAFYRYSLPAAYLPARRKA